jgi:hypothetical protein
MSEIVKDLRAFPHPHQTVEWLKPIAYKIHDAAAEIDKWHQSYLFQLDQSVKLSRKNDQMRACFNEMCVTAKNTLDQVATANNEVERLRAEVKKFVSLAHIEAQHIRFLKSNLINLQTTNERLAKALERIDRKRYDFRETVHPGTAWDAFKRLNEHVCGIYDDARATILQSQEEVKSCGCAPGDCAADEVGGPCREKP